MTQTIEQLTARVRELEEFKANVVKECASIIKHAHKDIAKQLAASQAYAEQLRKVLKHDFINWIWHQNKDTYSPNSDSDFPQRESAVFLDDVEEALALPRDTSAFDAYVAESREAAYREARKAADQLEKGLTRQRDLAVEALHHISLCSQNSMSSQRQCGELARAAIKESEAMAQGVTK